MDYNPVVGPGGFDSHSGDLRNIMIKLDDNLVNTFLVPTLDKTGDSIFYHATRVAIAIANDNLARKCFDVSVLHDILEDTDCTVQDLEEAGLSSEVVAAIEALTHRDNERYIDYIKRVAHNDIAATVKLYDIEDNMKPDRLALCKRPHKYFQALAILASYGYYKEHDERP